VNISESLKYFRHYRHINYSANHPWILNLGGFHVSDLEHNSSKFVFCQILEDFAIPQFEDDINFGIVVGPIKVATDEWEGWGAVIRDEVK
jgi:hypothetical protein